MSFIPLKQKDSPFDLFYFIFLSTILFIQVSKVNCIPSNNSKIANYNTTMIRYQQAIINYIGFSKIMEKITMNIILKISFKDLQKNYEKLKSEMQILKTNQEKNELTPDNILEADKKISKFEINYRKTYRSYKRFEELKKVLLGMLKTLIIVLSILVIIVLSLIGVGSYFVIKRNKYYKLQEEISIKVENTEKDKETNLEKDFDKKVSFPKKKQNLQVNTESEKNEQLPVVETNNPVSKDYINNNFKN